MRRVTYGGIIQTVCVGTPACSCRGAPHAASVLRVPKRGAGTNEVLQIYDAAR